VEQEQERAAKEAELDKKEAEYIGQVNAKEINKVRFWELVGELDLERVMGESIAEGLATTQVTTQDKEVGESKRDKSAEEGLEAAERVVESLTVSKWKRKAVPARAKVYGEVDGPVSHLLKSSSICTNIYTYSATNASRRRCNRSASPHPMSGTARSARQTRAGALGGGRVTKSSRGTLSLPARGLGASWCLKWMSR
jgi:hypothetical protein